MKRTHNIRNDNRGFTLVEMAWVAFIMGILLLLAAPPVMNFLNSSRLAGASNELMSDMHYARSLATSTRSSHRIDFTANDYSIVEVSTAQVVRTRALPGGYTYATTGNPVFYAWGLADATNVTITHAGKTSNLSLQANGNVANY